MSVAISVRLPGGLDKALKGLAKVTDRPKTYIICKAIESYLEEYADYRIALDRLRDKDDPILTSAEFKKRLGY